ILRDAGDETHLVSVGRAEHDDARAEPVLEPIDRIAQRLVVDAVDPCRDELDAADVDGFVEQVSAAPAGREPRLALLLTALGRAAWLDELLRLVAYLVATPAHERGDAFDRTLVRGAEIERALPGHRLDAANAGRDAAFGDDLEETDIAGAAHVRAAAKLHREIAEAKHADLVGVFVAEERERTRRDRLVVRHHADVGVDVAPDLVVDHLLDARELVRLDRLVVREVEAQSIRCDERALLLHVIAEHAAKRGVQQMRRGVIEPYRLT